MKNGNKQGTHDAENLSEKITQEQTISEKNEAHIMLNHLLQKELENKLCLVRLFSA